MSFPRTFLWGTAASSTQCEGAAPAGDWIRWEQAGRAPASGEGNGFATRYPEDFRLLASLGLRHHRLSIEWARIEPEEGHRDPIAVDHYRRVLTAARDAGVEPWVCLHHFTLPGWFSQDAGGFLDDRSRGRYWPRHVAFCAETFGDLVAGWKPINEPLAYAAAGFLLGTYPPGKTDLTEFAQALRGIHLAARDAWRELRGGRPPVATIHNLSPLFPADDSPEAHQSLEQVDAVMWRVWMRALLDGVLEVPGRAPETVKDLADSCDFVGFSYYNASAVGPGASLLPYPPGARVGALGYAPWSEGLGLVLARLHEELPGHPLLICEHGVGTDDDEWRCEVLRDSLAEVEAALDDGINVRGFFHWTGVDNYEWTYGYDVPFGLVDRERVPRDSARLLQAFIAG